MHFLFFKKKKKPPQLYKARRVVFGLRWKLLLLISLMIMLSISSLAYIMFEQQKTALRTEKDARAVELVNILRDFSETFLDTDIDVSAQERREKYRFIERQINRFKNFNDDIFAIMLVDANKVIRVHNNPRFKGKKLHRRDVNQALRVNEEARYNFLDIYIKKKKYLSITYPLFVTRGEMTSLIKDFDKYYNKYKKKSKWARKKLFRQLSSKYNLDKEKKSTKIKKKVKSKRKTRKKRNRKKRTLKKNLLAKEKPKVNKEGDIDFLFLRLMRELLHRKGKRLERKNRWMLSDRWLMRKKIKILKAIEEKETEKITALENEIQERLNYINARVEKFRRLGALIMLFNVAKIEKELNENIHEVIRVALIVMGVGIIFAYLIVHMMLLNIKKLEKGAIALGQGNLNVRVEIKSGDELGRLADIFNLMVTDLKEKFKLEKFVSGSTREMIQKSDEKIKPGDVGRKSLAFLFSDVRGFTSFTESNDPAKVIEILNSYFDLQSRIIKRHGGDIDDFVGDAIMAHFEGNGRADRAITAAIEIMKKIKEFNARKKKKKESTFRIGIGLHMGDVVVGNIGSKSRMDFAAIGDAVNLGSRLCSIAEPDTTIISDTMLNVAEKKYRTSESKNVNIKGKAKKVKVHRLIG